MAEMTDLPTWYPGIETKPAPMPLLLVQAFVNTRDVEDGSDLLSDAGSAAAWLVQAGLIGRNRPVTSTELGSARATRDSIRGLVESHGSQVGGGADLGPLRDLADTHAARLTVGDGGVLALQNHRHDDVSDGLFELLLIIRRAQEDGTWSRLRVCANPDCRWAFFDRSRNQQGHWCNMAVCGNRLKNRQLRARRRWPSSAG
jgi:predicted RNA-binding Zn ribbon-like protein